MLTGFSYRNPDDDAEMAAPSSPTPHSPFAHDAAPLDG